MRQLSDYFREINKMGVPVATEILNYYDLSEEELRGPYYKRSGRCNCGKLLLFTLAGMAVAIPLALAYQLAINYIPFIYVNVLLTLGLGFCGGAMGVLILNKSKCRNFGIDMLVGLLLGTWMLWLSWGVLVSLLVKEIPIFAAMRPDMIMAVAGKVMEPGTNYLTIRSIEITGLGLITVWGIEALLILGTSLAAVLAMKSETTFCESCQKWTKRIFTSRHLQTCPDIEFICEKLESRDFAALLALEPVTTDTEYTLITIDSCDCGKTFLLTVSNDTITVDGKGNESVKKLEFLRNFYITQEEMNQISSTLKPAL